MIIPNAILRSSLREAGIADYGLLGGAALREACSGLPEPLRDSLGVEAAGGAIAAALPYGEGPPSPPAWAGQPLARLAFFARANWYAELGARLEAAASRIRRRLREEGFEPGKRREWRYFANSRLPEKRLALASGLGRLGRHGLVMLPGPGSAVVLGLLLSPLEVEAPEAVPVRLDDACEGCGACVAACPTGALKAVPGAPLSEGEGFVRELCLQNWTTIPGPLPPAIEAAWGNRLYGCDACQEACPRFAPDPAAVTGRGLLGPGLSAPWLAASTEAEIKTALRGSVLGMRWIPVEALRRNAALSAGRR